MGRSITPTYRIEITEVRRSRDARSASLVMAWEGKATYLRLSAWIAKYEQSLEANGVNAHIAKGLGYIPRVAQAKIIRQATGETVESWVIDEHRIRKHA